MKTVLVHGCWDVIHNGHIKHLEAAKRFGDRLIVSVTADRFVNKGPGRPYFTAPQRAQMLQSLKLVDEVIISDHPTAVEVIERVKPDYYVKGQDYKDFSKDVTGEIQNEKAAVEACGGRLVFTDEETNSSSRIINEVFQPFTDDQKRTIEDIKSLGGLKSIEGSIDQLSKLKVLVVGEPILDVYRFVKAEGISSKSPTVSARFQFEETYEGGATAIKKHLKDFCDVDMLMTLGPWKTVPKKVRYIEHEKSQRIFEVTDIDEHCWATFVPRQIRDHGNNFDVVVAADFGHGLFEGETLEALESVKSFVGLNVQTNSSNYGFNSPKKHKRFDYLCLDTRELRLAWHDRYSSPTALAHRMWEETDKTIGLTVGSNGAFLVDKRGEYFSPAFADNVVDATGAGDAYFAITTVLLASGCKPELVPFIGNVFAGLKTKIIGNKSSVTKAMLLKACAGILK